MLCVMAWQSASQARLLSDKIPSAKSPLVESFGEALEVSAKSCVDFGAEAESCAPESIFLESKALDSALLARSLFLAFAAVAAVATSAQTTHTQKIAKNRDDFFISI